MKISHEGKVALVTGGGSGIGHAISIRLGEDGAAVVVLDVNIDVAHNTIELIKASGRDAMAVSGDVRSRQDIERAVQKVMDRFGHLDLVVNNAGVITMTDLDNLTDDEWDFVVDVNLKGPYVVSQIASRSMAHGGAIVNLGTVESEVVVSSSGHCQVHYNASKGGVKMLTKALAVELAAKGIRVNAIAPGPVNTGFSGGDIETPEAWEFLRQRLLVPRVGKPEDMANAISFLLSDQASFINGIMLPVDGGWLTR